MIVGAVAGLFMINTYTYGCDLLKADDSSISDLSQSFQKTLIIQEQGQQKVLAGLNIQQAHTLINRSEDYKLLNGGKGHARTLHANITDKELTNRLYNDNLWKASTFKDEKSQDIAMVAVSKEISKTQSYQDAFSNLMSLSQQYSQIIKHIKNIRDWNKKNEELQKYRVEITANVNDNEIKGSYVVWNAKNNAASQVLHDQVVSKVKCILEVGHNGPKIVTLYPEF